MNTYDTFLRSSTPRPATLRAALEERYNGEALRRLAQAKTKRLCILMDNGTIAVPAESEAAFRRAVKDLGYPVLARANSRD